MLCVLCVTLFASIYIYTRLLDKVKSVWCIFGVSVGEFGRFLVKTPRKRTKLTF